MKNINITSSKGPGILATLGLFSIVLGSLLMPISQANAQVVLASVAITASPGTICPGQSANLNWSSTDATSVSISPGIGSVTPFGNATVSPSTTTTYIITGSNSTGGSATASATVTVNSPGSCTTNPTNPTVSITANPSSVPFNGTSIVSWTSSNANTCTATGGSNGWAGVVATSGSFNTGALTNSTTYNIACTNSTGAAAAATTVSVGGVIIVTGPGGPLITIPSVFLNADNTSVPVGTSTTIRWYSNNVSSCVAGGGSNGWSGSQATSGAFYTGPLNGTTTYNIYCTGIYGSANASVTVFVNGIQNITPVNVTISADRTNIAYNQSTIIRWFPSNATTCNGTGGSNGWAGVKSTFPGTFNTGPLQYTTTYTISCSNSLGGFNNASVTVGVGQNTSTVTTRTVVVTQPVVRTAPNSLVVITSSLNRQPIMPVLDNSRPHPGDEINYTVSYQNIGNGAITNLTLQLVLPQEVDYMFSTPSNPSIFGNTLIFNLGTLKANGTGTVTVRVRVRDNISDGTLLNFPATLSYINPSGVPQAVSANVSAQIVGDQTNVDQTIPIGANIFGAGFLPTNIFGWLLLIIFILVLVLLAKYLFTPSNRQTI